MVDGPISPGIPNIPGTIVVSGRKLLMLSEDHQWLAPGVAISMPPPHPVQWRVLRVGYYGEEQSDDSNDGLTGL